MHQKTEKPKTGKIVGKIIILDLKKILLSALLLCSAISFSQETKFGAKVGFNIAKLTGDFPSGTSSEVLTGLHIGVLAEIGINQKFAFQPELLLSTQGGDIITTELYDGGDREKFSQTPKLTYLNLPLMFKYEVVKKLNFEFGPQIGYLLSAKSDLEYSDTGNPQNNSSVEVDLIKDGVYLFGGEYIQVDANANRFDFGLNVGASYDFTSRFFVQARYNFGLSNLDKDAKNNVEVIKTKNSVFQFSAGYKF